MRGKTLAIGISILSLITTEQAFANSGAAFVGGVIGGAIGSAIANGQNKPVKKKKATTTSKKKSVAPATAASGATEAGQSSPWIATPMPNGLMVATNAQGLTFTYDLNGQPRLMVQPPTPIPAASEGLKVPVSIVVDGSVFGLLEANVIAGNLVVDDPQVLGLEQRLKPAREISVTSTFSTMTAKLSGFTKAIEQLGVFRQQQALLAAANPQSAPENSNANPAPAVEQVASGSDATNMAVEPATNIPVASQPVTSIGAGASKVALVIGNGAYQNAGKLANPKNDASAISRVLQSIGFKVIVATDASKPEMEASIREFIQEARTADVSLFFYSGHGLEVAGENFLLPVDAKLSDETALSFEVINSKIITNSMGGEKKVGIILLDACRDNPFTKSLRSGMVASRAATVSSGLAPISTEGGGLVVAFATAPGDVAADGDGVNSPFTTALIKYLPQSGLEIDQVMKRVKSEVATVTNNDQRPWTNSDLTKDVFLAGMPN